MEKDNTLKTRYFGGDFDLIFKYFMECPTYFCGSRVDLNMKIFSMKNRVNVGSMGRKSRSVLRRRLKWEET